MRASRAPDFEEKEQRGNKRVKPTTLATAKSGGQEAPINGALKGRKKGRKDLSPSSFLPSFFSLCIPSAISGNISIGGGTFASVVGVDAVVVSLMNVLIAGLSYEARNVLS